MGMVAVEAKREIKGVLKGPNGVGERKNHRERRSCVGMALNLDRTVMRIDDPLANGQTEPRALLGMHARRISPIKAIEDLRLLLRRDPDPCIGDRQASGSAGHEDAHLYDSTLFGVFDRIVDEVQDQLPQSHLVARDRDRLEWAGLDLDLVL